MSIEITKIDNSDVLTEEEVIKILKKKLENDNFHLSKFFLEPASKDTLGFLGEHYKVKVTVVESTKEKNFSFFVKKIPTKVPQHYEYASKTRAFYKEIEIYKTLFVDLINSQKGVTEVTKWCPEYFYSRGTELFVLEDLSEMGYYMYPGRAFMDEEHLYATLRAMAAMHASSIIFEEKFNRGETNSVSNNKDNVDIGKATVGELYSHLTFETEASDEKGHPGNTFHEAGIKSQMNIIKYLPGYSEEEKFLIAQKLPDVLRSFYQLVKPSKKFKNVFVHGDLWANNILFRKDDFGKVKDALIIDFQLARYAPPAHDLLMFMHFSLEKSYMDTNQQKIFRYFYDAFVKELEKHSINAKKVFPWEDFLESCDYYQDLGLIGKLYYFQLILAPTEISNTFLSTPESFTQNFMVDRSEMVVESYLKNKLYRRRVTESMNEAIKRFNLHKK